MANSLITGVSGLQSHQKMIEIVGQNLANLNTVGFKSRTAVFSDVLYETMRGGTGGIEGVSGGTNPVQIGTGSQLSAMRTNFSSGNLQATGSALDFAIDGDGFFVVNSGQEYLYTRAGAFQIDKNGLLVDSGTGYPVQRFGLMGEPTTDDLPSFQVAGNNNIRIPLGTAIPGRQTSAMSIRGNLPSNGDGPIEEILGTGPWLSGGVGASSLTRINDLDFVSTDYVAGDSITINGTMKDGTPVSTTLAVDGTTTVGDLINAVNAAFGSTTDEGTTLSILPGGQLQFETNTPGEAFSSLTFADAGGNTGDADFTVAPFVVSQAGTDGDKVRGGVPIYDERGGVHTVTFEFKKEIDGTWTLNASMDPADGTIVDGTVSGITFSSNGTFDSVVGSGLGDSFLRVQFNGQPSATEISVNFNGDGSAGGLSSFAGEASMSSKQDGFANGVLTTVQVDSTGLILGVATNGLQFPLAQVAIGSFQNAQGLESVGNNFYRAGLASGDVQMGTAGSNGNGQLRSSQLEQSNVDIAQEFTRLIIAQRGFAANARTITVTNDTLQELTNLIR